VLKIEKETENKTDNKDQTPPESKKKMEICYFCHKKFDINQDDSSRYKYGKYPMCAYCAEFYGFYTD
jgi:hypothetical protein